MTSPHRSKPSAPNARLRGLAPRTAALLQDAAQRLDRNDLDGAEHALTGALALAPAHAETLRLHGLLEQRRGRRTEAESIYRRALEARPDDAAILLQLGELEIDRGGTDAALAALHRAVEVAHADADLQFRVGVQLDRLGRHEEALACGRRALQLAPAHPLARLLTARNLQALGRIEETAAEYRRLIAQGGPRAYQAWFSLVDLKTVRLDAKEVVALERLAADPKLGDDARGPLGFALGKVYEDAARYDDAFAVFARANAIVRRGLRWDAAAFSREIDAIRVAFDGDVAQAPADLGAEVVFVLGMPRSSTTLIEQILAAHSQVEGASELPDLPAVLAQESQRRGLAFPQWVGAATAADWERLGRDYLARTARWRARRPRSTDKLPNNWMLVGAIRAMLPAAKIVDCRRDALETCWSCYKQLFAPGRANYSYDLAELGACWRDYDRLSRHWRKRWPQHLRAQDYAALLDAPEREIRALLEFCGLPFEPGCLDFHAASRDIRTASAAQVRQPLQRDTARAAKYGERMATLRTALADD
ncbi:tetratricopeptide repeat-containing sulfotransferase family protein [Dokdonella sp.]|uniref:tetratricopeptide repeat-containing sulfotransferase family protein n=1 Tax=Dokdonella sp. TaxID=2291710 RepID=UPI001AFFFEAB|nr:tetratricopeptide repeat-containing sulfotransferase family protein [Dokdonella sp.]MBO9661399.1 sulfotransferase [Dokdonella sp.]